MAITEQINPNPKIAKGILTRMLVLTATSLSSTFGFFVVFIVDFLAVVVLLGRLVE
jgi:hypothetical protein